MMSVPAEVMGERNATLASRLARKLKKKGWMITTAESCTGGMLTSTLTDISGSSEWFKQGWVTYSNESKMKELGVERSKFEAILSRVPFQRMLLQQWQKVPSNVQEQI